MTGQVPGPCGWPLIGSLPAFARDPLAFWHRLANDFGGVVQYRIGTEQHFLISDPQGIAHVLRHDNVRYYRGKYHDLLKPAFGEGLLTANGESWRQQRRLFEPAFSRRRIAGWFDIVVEMTETRFSAWRNEVGSSPLDMAREMAGLIQEINAQILFGRTLPYQAHPALLDAVNHVNDSLLRQVKRAMVLGGLLNRLPLPDVQRFRGAVALLHRTVDALITHARTQAGGEDTLYASLVEAVEHVDRPPGEFHLRDQLVTLFLAGHETTAVALAWTFYYLTEHPEWLDPLYNEIVEVLGDRVPVMTDLERLVLTRRVVDESLRLRPPVYGIGRRARVDDEVGGYYIPAESPVILSPYVMHHHPTYWDCPDRFDPDRFLPERAAARLPFTYFPFGGGPHVCIGRRLATMEMLAIVALAVRSFRLTAPPGRRVVARPAITLRPHPGIHVRIAPR